MTNDRSARVRQSSLVNVLLVALCLLLHIGWVQAAEALDLGEAVDAPNLIWTTGGDGEWVGQTNSTFDGVDAASTALGSMGQKAWIKTTVNGPGSLSFWLNYGNYSFSGPFFSGPFFDLYVDDQLITNALGSVWTAPSSWVKHSLNVAAGTHEIKWLYTEGSDIQYYKWSPTTGSLDQVIWIPSPYTNTEPPTIQLQPSSRTVAVGSTTSFQVICEGAQPLRYQWAFKGTNILGATNVSYFIKNVQFTNAGAYSVKVSNGYGAVSS